MTKRAWGLRVFRLLVRKPVDWRWGCEVGEA